MTLGSQNSTSNSQARAEDELSVHFSQMRKLRFTKYQALDVLWHLLWYSGHAC
jgi:hypothetical protein